LIALGYFSLMRKVSLPEEIAKRIPPGQYLVEKFPVLSYGPTPRFDPANWDFRVFGCVERELRLSYEEFRALPASRQISDFHCVTTWSRLDNHWEGVRTADLIRRVKLTPRARFVVVHCEGGYTTNLPIGEFLDEDVMLAWRHDGRDLEPDHGWPLRLVAPKLYGWKSAKWVRAIEITSEDRRGFWEVRGYHNHADPWAEERYSYQEDGEDS
jgi:DMSO/TMAO reductase YedYZ molybdopterin-dependent catalytic subunit